MKIATQAEVGAPPAEVFAFVSDLERVGPCLPGAQITGREGDDWTGTMAVKVGPIVARYEGRLRFVELDEAGRRAVMTARAEETSGQGSAEASIVSTVRGDGVSSVLVVETDLRVRGRVAQFGRGAMEKIAQRMFDEFARNVEARLAAGDAAPADGAAAAPVNGADAAPAGAPRAAAAAAEPEPLDALGLLPFPAEKIVPLAGAALAGFAYGYLVATVRALRRRRP
jgi:carbon monoxide dehydrogenase subunit G